MPIQEGDIKVMLSQVLADVPEGGGAATGTAMTDGVSNNLFPDVSELDRVYGRVSLRKVFPKVDTETVETYYGAHVIVADPPDDPDVSAVIFSTGDEFDTREDAASRIEAYLNQGASYRGLLYGNHITGQAVITLIQRENVMLPSVGDTIVLRKNEGLVTQVEQYVRITDVDSGTFTFEDTSGEFERVVVTCGISDQLRADFPGFDAVRQDAAVLYTGKTKVYETLVADAARYYSVVPLTETASLGDFSVQAESIFTQIVPSARSETPIADARMNQRSAALIPTSSGTLSLTPFMTFDSTHPMYIGGGVFPGTLTVSRDGTTLTDLGGVLVNAGTSVGVIDYESGVMTLSTNVWSGSGNFTVSYRPAGTPTVVTETFGIPITQISQRLSYALTLEPVPAKNSLQVSYLSQGRWYTLEEDGSGAIRGGSPALGAGTLNFTTGTLSLTLGALPDVGSSVILVWSPSSTAKSLTQNTATPPRFAMRQLLGRAVKPGTLAISWNDGSARTASDLNGAITGAAGGSVQYNSGIVDFSPNSLPAKGTNITFTILSSTEAENNVTSFTDGGSTWTATLPSPIRAHSFQMSVVGQMPVRQFPGVDVTTKSLFQVFDDGSGNLQIANLTGNLTIGTVNYSTGAVAISKSISGVQSSQGVWQTVTPFGGIAKVNFMGTETRSLTMSILNGPGADVLDLPAWAWWTGPQSQAARAKYAGADGSSYSVTVPMNQLRASTMAIFERGGG